MNTDCNAKARRCKGAEGPTYQTMAYAKAAAATGKSMVELNAMALSVFASMLHHAMENPDTYVWSVIKVAPKNKLMRGYIDFEVNMCPPARSRARKKAARTGVTRPT